MATVYLGNNYSMAFLPSAWGGGPHTESEDFNVVGPDYLENADSVNAIGLKGTFVFDGSTYDGRITEIIVTSGNLPFPDMRIVTNFNMQNGEYGLVASGQLFAFIGMILDGDDTIFGSRGDQRLDGFDGNDVLIGGPGGDTLRGGNDNNTASYQTAQAGVWADLVVEANNQGDADGDTYADIDNLIGSRFGDVLYGDGNINRLAGGVGNDSMNAGGGNDVLTGGAGRDTLNGDLGADDFVYASVTESRGSTRDTIGDFYRSEGDDIWLRAIDANTKVGGNQNFSFIGKAAFSGVAGQLRYQKVGNDTHILGDVDGNKVADITIVSDKVVNFVQGDFVL